MTRFGRANTRRLVDRFGTSAVAHFIGVHPSTVRRWLKVGMPKARWEAASALWVEPATGKRKPTLSAVEKRHLQLTPEALAALFGVTLRTAKGWKRKGQIPPRRLRQVPEAEKPRKAPSRRKLPVPRGERFEGNFTEGMVWTLKAFSGKELTPDRVAEILDWASRVPTTRLTGERPLVFQLIMTGDVIFVEESEGPVRRGQPPRASGVGIQREVSQSGDVEIEDFALTSGVWRDRQKALADFAERLYDAVQYNVTIKVVTFKQYRWTTHNERLVPDVAR